MGGSTTSSSSSSSSSSSDSGSDRWHIPRFPRSREHSRSRGREREERRSRRPPVAVRERDDYIDWAREDRFERRLPRRREHFFDREDVYASRGSGPLIRISDDEAPHRPRLLRRQSSLDTFDRRPARRVERAPSVGRPFRRPPSPPLPPPRRHVDHREYYEGEEIDISEPEEIYSDEEEYHHVRERSRAPPRRAIREEIVRERRVEKTYPRKGRTKFPKRLVHPRALHELGYPYIEHDRIIIVQVALSKELIDEVITLSRDIRRVESARASRRDASPPSRLVREELERIVIRSPTPSPPRRVERVYLESPASSYARSERLLIEGSPSRVRELREEPREIRPRSVSVTSRRPPSPVIIERPASQSGQLVLVERPSREVVTVDDERKIIELERRPEGSGSVDITTRKIIQRDDGSGEEIVKVDRDRPAPNSRLMRAMLATMT